MDRPQRAPAITTCLWFVACLCLPILQNVFHFAPDVHVRENRKLADAPELSFSASYPHKLQDYWSDHFGLRLHLGVVASYISAVLNDSPNPSVVIGKDHWLYFAQNLTLPIGGEIQALIATAAERHLAYQEWLANRGIVNFVFIPIDKHNVYPEHLPDKLVKLESADLYRPFRDYVRAHKLPLNLVDIEDAILARKASGDLMYKESDSHWNSFGALVGAIQWNNALARVFPSIPKRTMADYDWKRATIDGGDLSQMISLPMLYHDTEYGMYPHHKPRAKQIAAGLDTEDVKAWCQPLASEIDDATLPTAVVFRDSYMVHAGPYVVENFRRSLLICNMDKFMNDIVTREAPDVVVNERLERDLTRIEAPSPEVAADLAALEKKRKAFADAAVFDRASSHEAPMTFHPRAPKADELGRVPVLEVSGTAVVATVLSIDGGDGHPQKRVLYPGAGTGLVTFPTWPTSIRVERTAGELAANAELSLTLKAIDPKVLSP